MRVNTGPLDAGMLLNSTHVFLRETTSRKRTKQDKLANPSAVLKETGEDKIGILSVQGPAPTVAQEHYPVPAHVKGRYASDSYLVVLNGQRMPVRKDGEVRIIKSTTGSNPLHHTRSLLFCPHSRRREAQEEQEGGEEAKLAAQAPQ